MRFPVFRRGADPRSERPILRKSKSYVEDQVDHGRADWVDDDDHSKGIICRERIYVGPREIPVETVDVSSIPPDAGLKYIPPKSWKNPDIARVHRQTMIAASQSWDWSAEPISA